MTVYFRRPQELRRTGDNHCWSHCSAQRQAERGGCPYGSPQTDSSARMQRRQLVGSHEKDTRDLEASKRAMAAGSQGVLLRRHKK